tara:strand:+ start:8810 stop:9115 length:306 start_codon:yes stop_codon:yes gene_type:complete
MSKFAQGKFAYATSDRSGVRYKYKDMRKEWNGLLVGKDEFEPKHPQLGPFRKASDPQALKDARPDRVEPYQVYVGIATINNLTPRPTAVYGSVGTVQVTTS